MKSGIASKKSATPKRARSAPANGEVTRALSTDGVTIDWEHVEMLGERARKAAIRMGIPPLEEPPVPPPTEEELARIKETRRLVEAVPRRKFKQTSEEMIREMRDAQVGIYPKRRDDDDSAGR